MPVIEIKESNSGRQSINGQVGRYLARRTFHLITNNANDERSVIEATPGIPKIYDPYQTATVFDPRLLVRQRIFTQRDGAPKLWDLVVEYDSDYELRDNPFSEPPEIRADSETYEEGLPGKPVVSYDPTSSSPEDDDGTADGAFVLAESNAGNRAYGKGIVNSAGEPFDPPKTITKSRPLIIFTRNEPNFQVAYKVLYENTVNQKNWSGLQARQAWLRSIRAVSHYQPSNSTTNPNIYYYRVEYTFALKAETWDLQLLDIGSYYLKYAGGSATRHAFRKEGTGEPRLGLLDNSNAAEPGKKLADNQDAQFRRWRVFREQDYTNLGINLNLALEFRSTKKRA